MNTMQHNLEMEKRLIDLLGYSLVGPDGSNRWLIMDENQNKVGYIQYKKLHNGNAKKGYVKEFGYNTFIDSPSVHCEITRRINDKYGKILNPDYNYSFDIKRENQDNDHIEMNIKDFPSLAIWSNKYGNIVFKVDFQGLFLNFKSNTENFNIEEVLIYKDVENEYHSDKEYVYQLGYCKKDLELSDDNYEGRTTTREISGIQYYDEDKLRIFERTWVNGKMVTDRDSIVEGSVEEMAVKHQMGIDCFNHFRFFINQIVPFNEDVVSVIVSDDTIKKNNLSMFFPEYEKEKKDISVQKRLTPNKSNN